MMEFVSSCAYLWMDAQLIDDGALHVVNVLCDGRRAPSGCGRGYKARAYYS